MQQTFTVTVQVKISLKSITIEGTLKFDTPNPPFYSLKVGYTPNPPFYSLKVGYTPNPPFYGLKVGYTSPILPNVQNS